MRLNWFSPLPPDQTDIARYAVAVVEALAEHAEVTVWTDGYRRDVRAPAGASIRAYQAHHDVFNAISNGDCTFFHIGNNPHFHRWIWDASRAIPGIVVLHDPALLDLLFHISGSPAAFVARMRQTYGSKGEAAAAALLRGETLPLALAAAFPLTQAAFENAIGGVLHWPGALRSHPVPMRCLPLPFAARSHPPRTRAIGAGLRARLVMLGYLGRNRRLVETLDALAAFPRRDRIRLDIYGPVDVIDIAGAIADRGLGGSVTHHGHAPPERLDAVLRDADMVVNLRVPTMGEVSGTQLRAWDHALPTLVSRTGWYATIPLSAAAFVRASDPRAEREDLHRHLDAFLDDPAPYAAMGGAGRRLLEERHGMGPYVSGLLEVARTAVSLAPAWAENHLADRIGVLTSGWQRNEALATATAERILGLFEA